MAQAKHIVVFKPYTSKHTTAFYSGQHSVLVYLKEKYGYQVTYLLDDPGEVFDGVATKYLTKNNLRNLLVRLQRKIFGSNFYWRIPYYRNVDFTGADIIITEGIHYLLIDYVKDLAEKVILHDSVSYDYQLPATQVNYLNRYFSGALAVIVNQKIAGLYQKNNVAIKTKTIGHAVDTALIPFVARTQCQGKIVSIGRLVESKGHRYIIEAMALLVKKYPRVTLDIYGAGPLEASLQALIASLALETSVTLKGFLPYKDLVAVFNHYDAFVSHPVAVERFEEPFLMANMEAMAAGLPVVTSNCGGVPYVVQDNATVVEQKDIAQIADALQSLMNHPTLVQKYSVQGREFIEKKYSIPVVAEQWDQVVKNMLP
jgi:glycosyltransferase involved in cell wall biosynthesis